MNFSKMLELLLYDLENFNPDSLNEIIRFVRSNKNFGAITLWARNHKLSQSALYDECLFYNVRVEVNKDPRLADLQLAALLLIVCDIESSLIYKTEKFNNLLSSVSGESDKFYWSRALATSYLLHKEVIRETICISA